MENAMICDLIEPPAARRGEAARFVAPLGAILRQLADAIRGAGERYGVKPVGVIPASVGEHVRHCLDHVRALLDALQTGRLDYDRRARGTQVESDPAAALESIQRLLVDLAAIDRDIADEALTMTTLLAAEGPAIEVQTTAGREFSFVLSHTIHHNALVGAMLRTLDAPVPDRFGYAPSTLRHQDDSACAR